MQHARSWHLHEPIAKCAHVSHVIMWAGSRAGGCLPQKCGAVAVLDVNAGRSCEGRLWGHGLIALA